MPELEQLFGTEQPVALVTGSAAPRVGNSIARKLAGHGFHVFIHGNRSRVQAEKTVAEIESAGGKANAVFGDVTSETDCTSIYESVIATSNRIDVLINSAAIWEEIPFEEITADDVKRHFEINALGTFMMSQKCGLKMVAQDSGGVIINIGDWSPARPYLGYAAYFPSKGSIVAMSRSLAVELAQRNPRVRVNVIHPGPVMIPESMPQLQKQRIIDSTLVKREGSPQNVADATWALITNDFITGAELHVDGGRSIFASDDDVRTTSERELPTE